MKKAEEILRKYYRPKAYDVKEAAEMGRGELYFFNDCIKAMEEYHQAKIIGEANAQANVSGSLPSDSECEILAEIVRKHLYDAGTRDIRIEISWKGIRRVIKKWNEIQARQ